MSAMASRNTFPAAASAAEWLERGRIEDAQMLLGVAAALGRFGAWSVDVRTGITRWTEETRALQRPPLSRESDHAFVLGQFAPEYRELLLACYRRCAAEGTPFDVEVEALTEAQERVWVRVIAVAVPVG
jgi:hypothetical protein